VDIFVNVVAEVVVNDMHDILDVKTTGSDGSGDQDGALAFPIIPQWVENQWSACYIGRKVGCKEE
jgi:hypothetical protein